MDDNAIHEWLIKCFGPIQGEMAWQQISQLPEEIREQLMSQDPSRLPNPSEVQQMMAAFSAGGLNTMGDMQRTVEEGPINVKLAKSIALQQANASGSASSVSAVDGEAARRAMSEANLWLDTACEFNPAPGDPDVLTRAGWVEGTIDQWAKFSSCGRVDERRFGFGDFGASWRRVRRWRDCRHVRRTGADSDSRRYERPSPTDEAAGQHVLCHAVGACGRQSEP